MRTGNATILPATSKTPSAYLAFDTGPGNVFIDAAMRILTNGEQHYDHNGALGAKGEADIDGAIVDDYLTNEPYFQQKLPKTTGRELFSDDVARLIVTKMKSAGKSTEAIIATITRITAESIVRAYEQFVVPLLEGDGIIDEIYICGGGAYNPNIKKHLQSRLPKSRVSNLDAAPSKLDPSAKEAILFALLGFLAICGRPVPVAADAESKQPAIMGVVTPGQNYHDVLQIVVGDPDFPSKRVLGRVIM
jgi:1,6-anhydro-N-acetylmuramate kinase